MNYDGFIAKYNGKGWDYDGWYGNQCVDEILFYLRDVYGYTGFGGNAKDWYHNYGGTLAQRFERITNNPNDYNQVPKRGDIIIWDGTLPGSGGYGHIAIFDKVNGPGSFTSLDQNWGGQYVHFVTHNWGHVLGWLTPRAASTPQGGDTPMNRDEEANAYRIVLERDMEHGGSGRTGYKFILDGAAELKVRREERARELVNLHNHINNLNVRITELTSDDAQDEATIKAGLDEIGRLTGELSNAHDKLKELENNPQVVYTHDQETKNQIDTIYRYFVGQFKTFLKYIKKEN